MSSKAENDRPFEPRWQGFALGSLPHTDPARAWDLMVRCFPEMPGWPQLPHRSPGENIYAQFGEHFPGLVRGEYGLRVHHSEIDRGLAALYLAYLENNLEYGRIDANHSVGLAMLRRDEVALPAEMRLLRGQVTGPVSFGLTTLDEAQRPILYDEVLSDAVGKHLALKAAWQEAEMRKHAPQTLIMVEEPYMASFGSSFVALSRAQVVALLDEIWGNLKGLTGVHCCGNTEWSILLNTSVDVLSLDAYDYGQTLAQHGEEVGRFLQRGGTIAWGIVPASTMAESETVDSLVARLEHHIDGLQAAGVPREAVVAAGLVSPSCGLAALTPALAELVCELTVGVAREMQRRYVAEAEREPEESEPADDDDPQP
jgi:hypothetical protein